MEESGEMALPAGFGAAGRGRPDAARPPLDGASSAGASRAAGGGDARNAFRGDAPDAAAEASVAQAREAAAFLEDAVGRWGDTVLRLAASRTGNRADAEDVFQSVFLRLHQGGKRFCDDEHLKAWLLHVTVNCCNDLHRSPWHRKRAALGDDDVARLADRPGPNAPEGAAGRDDELEAALARLSDRQRTAVHLHYYEGYATDEIARITGERPATVRSHLHHARKALKIDLGARP